MVPHPSLSHPSLSQSLPEDCAESTKQQLFRKSRPGRTSNRQCIPARAHRTRTVNVTALVSLPTLHRLQPWRFSSKFIRRANAPNFHIEPSLVALVADAIWGGSLINGVGGSDVVVPLQGAFGMGARFRGRWPRLRCLRPSASNVPDRRPDSRRLRPLRPSASTRNFDALDQP